MVSSSNAADVPVSAPDADRRQAAVNRRLWIVLGVAALWWLALAALALLTANPVTLNVEQIRRADYVVTARVSAERRDTLVVEKEWKQNANLQEVRVENLSQTRAEPGRPYLVPLSRVGEMAYRVTATQLPGHPPLVYPATEEALRQLTDILSAHR